MQAVKYLTSPVVIIASIGSAASQNPDLTVTSEKIRIHDRSLDGYGIVMDLPQKEIFREWWKFSKEFSRNETRKGQIRHTIPPVDGESTVPVMYYSEVIAQDSLSSKIKAALNDNGLKSNDIAKYNKQVRQLLIDFKVDYYRNNLQGMISETEKKARKISKDLDKHVTQGIKLQKKLDKLNEQHDKSPDDLTEIEYLQNRLNLIEVRKDSINADLILVNGKLEELRDTAGSN